MHSTVQNHQPFLIVMNSAIPKTISIALILYKPETGDPYPHQDCTRYNRLETLSCCSPVYVMHQQNAKERVAASCNLLPRNVVGSI